MAIDNVGKDKSIKLDAEPKVEATKANQIEKRRNRKETIEGIEYKRVRKENGKIKGKTGHERGWKVIFGLCKEEGLERTEI